MELMYSLSSNPKKSNSWYWNNQFPTLTISGIFSTADGRLFKKEQKNKKIPGVKKVNWSNSFNFILFFLLYHHKHHVVWICRVINGSNCAKWTSKKVFKLVQSIEKKAKRPGKSHKKADVFREWDEVRYHWNIFFTQLEIIVNQLWLLRWCLLLEKGYVLSSRGLDVLI